MRWGNLNKRRSGQYIGMVIDDPIDPLMNLRFADDVLLVVCSSMDVSKMITDLGREAGKLALKLHMGKAKVLTNCLVKRPSSITCCSQSVYWMSLNRSAILVESFHVTAITTLSSLTELHLAGHASSS